jgi:hypothetical protein
MNRHFRSIAVLSLFALGLSVVGIPNAMATTPTRTAVFQCNLFTSVPFNLNTFDKTTNSTINLPNGSTSSCMDLLEQLMYLGLTNVNVSYQTQSNGGAGNYITFAMSDGTVGNL